MSSRPRQLPTTLPTARTPDPMAAPALRWGVLGTGWIADRFVRSVQAATAQRVVAVGSRRPDTATAFASTHGIPCGYGSYEELVADPSVDVVYVATPHNSHHPDALLALRAGKHVLVEKPLALNAAQAGELAAEASARDRLCTEALWTFFLPKFDVIRQLLADGVLGDVRVVLADHGQWFPADHRILRADLAGGPMLDLGTYPISLVTELIAVSSVQAAGHDLASGLNGQFAAVLGAADGAEALVHATVLGKTPTAAFVGGSAANLSIVGDFYMPGDFTLTTLDGEVRLDYHEPAIAHAALHFQAAEIARVISAGATESPLRTLAASIETLRVMDAIRVQIGARFAEED